VVMGDGEDWEPMSPMHDARTNFASAAVAGSVVIAGGTDFKIGRKVFDEVLNRWLRLPLPCDIPVDNGLHIIGSALLQTTRIY